MADLEAPASLAGDFRYRLLVESITDYAIYLLDPTGLGFGSKLVRRTVEGQFGGTITHDWSTDGLVITMTAPLSSIRGAG